MMVASRIVPLFEQQALLDQALVDALEELLSNPVRFQQVPEVEDCGLIRDPAIDHVDPRKATKAGGVDQHLLHQRVRQREPLLQQMDPQHHLQRKRRPPSLGRRLVVDGTNQGEKKIPRQRGLHLLQEDLPPRLLLGVGLLVIRKTELEGDHHPFPVSS